MSPRAKIVKNDPILQEEASVFEVVTFEDALAALEGVISELEKEGLSLDRALTIFEQGIILMRKCDSHLKNAQGKMKELLKGENGEFVEKVLGDTLESFLSRDEK
jgi:exodeoxyribonuclease VII small subunit